MNFARAEPFSERRNVLNVRVDLTYENISRIKNMIETYYLVCEFPPPPLPFIKGINAYKKRVLHIRLAKFSLTCALLTDRFLRDCIVDFLTRHPAQRNCNYVHEKKMQFMQSNCGTRSCDTEICRVM